MQHAAKPVPKGGNERYTRQRNKNSERNEGLGGEEGRTDGNTWLTLAKPFRFPYRLVPFMNPTDCDPDSKLWNRLTGNYKNTA